MGKAFGSSEGSVEGGCACGAVRYRLEGEPLFVHCCYCTRCQRETGSPFAHHAIIEWTRFTLLTGEPELVSVPTDSGGKHWVARCPTCRVAMWNVHGTRRAVVHYVRVGTLDEPARCPPQAHIFVRSKQPWVKLPMGAETFDVYYDASKTWSTESLARYQAAKAARAEERAMKRAKARA
jgi:hypothetical protein